MDVLTAVQNMFLFIAEKFEYTMAFLFSALNSGEYSLGSIFAGIGKIFSEGISFTTASFLIFFPVCIALYYLIPKKLANFWLLFCSYVFYILCTIDENGVHLDYLALLVFCTAVTYMLARMQSIRKSKSKLVAACAIIINLSLLIYYKYSLFFAEVLSDVFSLELVSEKPETIFLPIGISFYIFLSIGYTIDVYRKKAEAEKNIFDFALFVSFFPHIVSGPIARADGLLHHIKIGRRFNYGLFCEGMRQMLWGYFKKMVISGNASGIANIVFANPLNFSGIELISASFFYSIQIYADFSGYSDIAIGAAKMLNIPLSPNFNAPYFSKSIGEFWSRWHISLSSWLRDYLYIPLGGNRKGRTRTLINILIVFLLSGLWHGAALTFIAWGAMHGIWSILSRVLFPLRTKIYAAAKLGTRPVLHRFTRIASWIFTMSFINFAWIFFRSSSIDNALFFISGMGKNLFIPTISNPKLITALTNIGFYKHNGLALLICTAFMFIAEYVSCRIPPEQSSGKLHPAYRLTIAYLLFFLILFFGSFTASGFIYGAF